LTGRKLKEIDRQRFLGVVVQERYGLILALMLLGYVLEGVDRGVLLRLINALIWTTLLIVALLAPGIPSKLRTVGVASTGVLLVIALSLLVSDNETARIVLLLFLSFVQILALIAIAVRIAHHEKVGPQTVMGAIAGYFLIGLSMGALYQGLDLAIDATMFKGITNTGDYIYFSLITLTTVGYGDITPATDIAKRLVSVEALVGQVFLVTLVSRLVALWGRPLRVKQD
jgi:voltage-gated potassium channel Kch